MTKWINALISEWALSIWWILSALSTLSTFVFPGMSGRWRLGFAVSTAVGFAWANFQVFQKNRNEISRLENLLAPYERRRSDLRIIPHDQPISRYILDRGANDPHGNFQGGYLEFHLRIENNGTRNSIVNSYRVEIRELHADFGDLRPVEGQMSVLGRHCQTFFSGGRPSSLCRTGIITILPESTTDYGTLVFFIPTFNLEKFANAGLRMHGNEKRFDGVHCQLTVADQTGSSDSAEFELQETREHLLLRTEADNVAKSFAGVHC